MQPMKRVLCIHDLSCVGRCSLSVILPVISAMGVQACPLPTALLSTHTGGLGDPAVLSAASFCQDALDHWDRLRIRFDCVYSGYLGDAVSAELVRCAFEQNPDACKLVDPVLADHGKLYRAVTPALCQAMIRLCGMADVLCPNVTESAVLLGLAPEDRPFAPKQLDERLYTLREAFPQTRAVVITGVRLEDGTHGNALLEAAFAPRLFTFAPVNRQYPGTGDLFAAVLAGALTRGQSVSEGVALAADFVACAAAETLRLGQDPRFGTTFERVLYRLINRKEDESNCQP